MAIRKSFTWPSPVHEERTSVLVLSDERLWFAHGLVPEVAELVVSGQDDEVPGSLVWPLGKVARVSFLPARMDLRVIDTAGRGRRIGPIADGDLAEEILRGIAAVRKLRVQKEGVAPKELLRSPLLTAAVVLVIGGYLAILAGTKPSESPGFFAGIADLARSLGGGVIWTSLLLGLAACAFWGWKLVQSPWEKLVASGSPARPSAAKNSVDHSVLREATARLLDVEIDVLEDDTNFCEDLRVPPGELFERLTDLEEELQVEIPDKKGIRTYGQLRSRLD